MIRMGFGGLLWYIYIGDQKGSLLASILDPCIALSLADYPLLSL